MNFPPVSFRLLLFLVAIAGVNAADSAPGRSSVDAPSTSLAAFSAVGSSFIKDTRLPELDWSEAQIAAFLDGVGAALRGRAYSMDATAEKLKADMIRRIQALSKSSDTSVAAEPPAPVGIEQYLKEVKKRFKMQQTDSGLLYLFKTTGRGIRPSPQDTIVASIACGGAQGEIVLPGITGEHVKVKMTDFPPGLLEGLQMMTVESEVVFIVPPALSFSERDWPVGAEPGTALMFRITLHEVISPAATE